MPEHIPPILKTRGLRLVEIGENEQGAYLRFESNKQRVREVIVYMLAHAPIKWHYAYAIWDPSTKTVVSYEGDFGDPELDRRLDIRSA